jgi:predicted nucleic acid-binding protein
VKIVVDTNIVFSCLVRSSGNIGELLLRDPGSLLFYTPDLLEEELDRHRSKLRKAAKLTDFQLDTATAAILNRIELISEPAVSFMVRAKARSICESVDEFGAPFVALVIELNALLWTGDLALVRGLRKQGFNQVITTMELMHIR